MPAKEGTAYAPSRPRSPSHSPHVAAHLAPRCARSDFYRQRFESSVLGEHSMLPPPELLERFKSKEEPSTYPSGQDTSFKNLTPMPFRFTTEALGVVNERVAKEEGKPVMPTYATTSHEVGKLGITDTDLPMRWYGRSGMFTSSWDDVHAIASRTARLLADRAEPPDALARTARAAADESRL